MNDLKNKLHELIEGTDDNILLENIYRALKHMVDVKKRDILDDLTLEQLNSLNESIAEYRSGKTKSHEEVMQMLKEWRSK